VNTSPAAQAVEALIHEYGKLVFHTIYGLTGDWEESQDLTQDTFHQALKSIDAARAKSGEHFHAKAWLLRIALNTVLMQRRRRSLFRFIPLSSMQKREQAADEKATTYASTLGLLQERAAPVQPTGYGITESGDLETQVAEQDAVRRTLARLSEPLRLCLVLSIIGQFSTSEIAHTLDLEEAAVRQRLARARKQFQQFYRLENGEEIYDQTSQTAATRSAQIGQESQQSHTERVESRELHKHTQAHSSSFGRDHAERFYRNPAVTPLR
jgi:RNA polymerase sigma factor (sigma-70 family)